MSMATRTDTQSPALHVVDSHDLIARAGRAVPIAIHPSVSWPGKGHPEIIKMGCRQGYFHTSAQRNCLKSRPVVSQA